MRLLPSLVLSLTAALALGACSAVPPAASPEPARSSVPSVSASPSPEPSVAPSSSPSPSPAASDPLPTSAAHGHSPVEVTIVDFAFVPAAIEVEAGQTVRWTNEGGQPHTIKTDDGTISSAIILREPFEWTAAGEAGTTIEYICGIHPSMTGSITITE